MEDGTLVTGYLGYTYVPEGQRGWQGWSGATDIQGPPPRPEGYVDPPQPHQVADALVVTSWTCPHCKADNDVWGEGAVFSWMECSTCFEDAFLVM